MKLFLLLTDLLILIGYGVYALLTFQGFSGILVVLLFFFAVRVLALSVHPAFSFINLALLYFLLPFRPLILVLAYLFYTALYIYMDRREGQQRLLTRENTKLQIEQKNSLRYQFMKENYESQAAITARLEERRAIAQQIHDLLGHSLTAATLQLEAASELVDKEPERAKGMMQSAAGQLREGIAQVREAVHQMRAEVPALKLAELQALLDRFRLDSGLVIRFTEEGQMDDLPNSHWQVFLGNAREALTNVIRHAGATEAVVSLKVLPGMARLEVSDNGHGCENIVEGMGLSGMRERAREQGGSLIVRSEGGLQVITLLPRKELKDD
ncbi:MAG: sensor histidine kinase [Clostridiales bacterium]|nr:sensor histidine kinase [Clostridiales bacterium]